MKKMSTAGLKVGDKVKLTKATRHKMVAAGSVGTVVEIRDKSEPYTDGVVVEFMVTPSPQIARMFGKDPGGAEPLRCLFAFGRLPFDLV